MPANWLKRPFPPNLPGAFPPFTARIAGIKNWARDFSGSALGLLIRLALPAMVGMMVQSAYFFIDRIFVGKALDLDAVAGITIAFPYMLVLQAASMLIGIGAAARVSIKLGEKKNDEAELILGNAASMLMLSSLVLTVAGLMALPSVLKLMTGSHESIRQPAQDYLQIIIFATAFQLVGYGLNSIIRAEGNTRTAMWTLLIGVILNLGLAPLFLFVFHWGMRGAAFATAISQGVSVTWVLAYFLRGHSVLRFHWRLLKLHAATCGRILLFGLPMFVMMIFAALMLSCLNYQAQAYGGDMAVAVWGGIFSLLQLANNPVYGVNQGTQPVIGFNHGGQRFDRVKQALLTGILFASTLTIAGFIVAMVFPGPVLRLFINPEKIKPDGAQADPRHGHIRHADLLPDVAAGRLPGRQRELFSGDRQAARGDVPDAFAAGLALDSTGPDLAAVLWPRRRMDGPADFRLRLLADNRHLPVLRTAASGHPPSKRTTDAARRRRRDRHQKNSSKTSGPSSVKLRPN